MPASPELLLTLSTPVLRDLLATFAPTTKLRAAPSHALAHAIFTGSHATPKKLASLLVSTLPPLCTPAGRAAFLEGAVACSDPRADSFLSTPHADVAPLLLLALERETKPAKRRALRRLVALATQRVSRDLPERSTYELVPRSPDAFGTLESLSAARVIKALTRALADALLDMWSTTTPDGTLHVALFLKQPTVNRLVHDAASRTKIAQREDVPVAVDGVRIFATESGTRVAVTVARPELLPTYGAALDLALRPSFTLRPLQKLAPDAFARVAAETRGLAAIDAIAVRYRRPRGRRIEVRGPNALDPAEGGPRRGYIDRVTLRMTTSTGATVDAFLQLPHRVEISDPAFEAPVRAALSALGLFAPGSLPDDARSLAPYEHGDWRWRAVLGHPGFERLRKARLLVRTQSSHVSSEEHRMHGAAYVVRDVPGEPDVQYALAEDRSLGARLVGPKDRVAWRLDTDALGAVMRKDLGAHPAPAPLAIAGVLDLGVVTLASGKLRIVYAMAEPPAGWVDAVRRASGVGVTPVVLVPRGHAGESPGMLEIELELGEQLGTQRVGRVLGRIAEALGVGDEVDLWRRCQEDLVVDLPGERLWLMGVPVNLSEKPWQLVAFVARVGEGKAASTKEIGLSISKSGYPDVAARKARGAMERQMRSALEAAGVDASIVERILVSEGRLGLRFGVSVRVLGAG